MAHNQNSKLTKATVKTGTARPIRLQPATIKKLQKILETVNKKEFGKRIRPDAVIATALGLIGATEIEAMRRGSMSNTDRLEMAYRHHAAKAGGISKDDFLGLLLAGKLNIFDGQTGPEIPVEEVYVAAP